MFYIVQKNVFRESNYDKIFTTLDRLNLEYEEIDLSSDSFEVKTGRKDIFVFGSIKLARLSAEKGWTPGSFYGGNHDFNIYKDFYKENLLNFDSEISNALSPIEWASGETKFIRPTKDSKAFTGRVFTKTKWEHLINESEIAETIKQGNPSIQISSPKKIYKEARIWVVDGKVVTSSYYKFGDNVVWSEQVEPEGLEFAQKMVDLYQVAEAFVMDICLTPNGWKIVEINCINCSGFYQGDLQKIIISLEDKYNPQ